MPHKYLNLLLATLLISPLPVSADTPPTGRWEPIVEMWDEFNGTQLDLKKWEDHNPYYSGKPPGMFMPHNVKLENGELNLYTRMENVPGAPPGYHSFTTAMIRSKNRVKYGYFEVRAKATKSRAVNAFWLYRWMPASTFEIDIFEIAGTAPGREFSLHTNTHVYYGSPELENDQNRRSDPKIWKTSAPLANDYHLYGLEWDEKEIKWYLDGKVVRTKANTDWRIPMTILLTTETHPDWMGLPERSELPAAFKVDYIRAWRKTGAGAGP